MDLRSSGAISENSSIGDSSFEPEDYMNQSPYSGADEASRSKPGSAALSGANPACLSRLYRHALNSDGGIDSICQRCEVVIASCADEWSLLSCEERHICVLRGNQTPVRS